MKLILSAIPAELRSLVQAWGAEPFGEVWRAGDVVLAPAGVGFFAAYAGVLRLLGQFPQVKEVLFVGTAGVYPGVEGIPLGSYAVAQAALLADGAAEMGFSKYASFLQNQEIAASINPNPQLPQARVACLLSLTLDAGLASQIAQQRQAQLENMELYAIALAAAQAQIPWGGLLGVTNWVGPEGHQQWQANRSKVEGQAFSHLSGFVGYKI